MQTMKSSYRNMKFIHNSRLFLIMMVLLLGCVPVSSTIMPTQTATPLPSFTPTSPTPTNMPRPTQTATLTPPPTLQPEQAKEAIKTLLKEPVDCTAPCFWGIVPDQTTLGEAKNIFASLGLSLKYTNTLDGRKFYEGTYDLDGGLSVSPLLALQGNTVINLTIYITPEIQQDGEKREWSAYSPEILVARYGEPSRVDFALDWGPRSYFEMDMYFDEVDLIVEYMGHNIIPKQKGSPQVCPLTAQFEAVRLWMGKDPYQPPPPAVPLEEATSITMEEFAKSMAGDPGEACIIVNGDVFP